MPKAFTVKWLLVILAVALLTGCSLRGQGGVNTPGSGEEITLYQGLGSAFIFREGPGADAEGVPVYSINTVWAAAVFDAEGRIVDVTVDVLEVATPNYDGAGMPRFLGWPGTEGYNVTDVETGEVVGKSENTVENIVAEIERWRTKRERGDDYNMNPTRDWYEQMDAIEEWMRGKTIAEIEAWAAKFTSDRTGRPLDPNTDNAEDRAKLEKLTEEEKKELVEFRSRATMSLNDAHGNLIGAIKDAYEKRVEFTVGGN
ncbi:MAG: FMN-binding protein [Firmicutes bacterium]|mgnify:CR=1 FL=1|nr:FMN-binding protein [Bacillota bacterium]